MRLKSGETYTRDVEHAKGSPEVPLTASELETKFTDCARQTLSEASTQRALDDLNRLETLPDIRPLSQLLRG